MIMKTQIWIPEYRTSQTIMIRYKIQMRTNYKNQFRIVFKIKTQNWKKLNRFKNNKILQIKRKSLKLKNQNNN